MTTNRRDFVKRATLAAAAGAASVAGAAGPVRAAVTSNPSHPGSDAPPPQGAGRTLDPSLLAALGEAVLPESLGAAGRARAVRAFSTWLAGYTPVSEEMHGYGNQEITYTPSDPAPGWSAQLSGLELLARRKHARGFGALDIAARRELVRTQLGRQRNATLSSNPLVAPHVILALLSHWARSSEATDVTYGVRISKENCRVLADSPRKPLPLAPGERS